MIHPELYKIRHHRTPIVLAGFFAACLLIGPIYFLFRPGEADNYLSTLIGVYWVSASIFPAIFGCWLVGNEYGQGTLRRVLAVDASRPKLLAAKLAAGSVTFLAGMVAVAGIGLAGTAIAAGINGPELSYDGLVRALLSSSLIGVVTFLVGFGISIVSRSNTYAIISTLAIFTVFGQLLTAVPKIGDYTPVALTNQLGERIADVDAIGPIGHTTASLMLVGMILGLAAVALTLFERRDI